MSETFGTFGTFRQIIVDHIGVDPEIVTMESKFVDDLGFDSLDKIEVLLAVEAEFCYAIDDEESSNVVTVSDAVRLIDSRILA